MCAAAHGWAGLGRIIYAASSKQLTTWLTEFGAPPARVKPIPIQEVISDVEVIGPVDEFSEILKVIINKILKIKNSCTFMQLFFNI